MWPNVAFTEWLRYWLPALQLCHNMNLNRTQILFLLTVQLTVSKLLLQAGKLETHVMKSQTIY